MFDGECTYTHLLHAHFSAHSADCVFPTLLMRVTYTHGSRLKFMKKVFVACVSLISPSRLLPSHPSLLFLYIHFDITFQSTILPYFPVLKAQDTRNPAPASRSLATWPSQMQTQVMSPTSSPRILPWMMTRRS